ncbi:hypothetical protein [Kordia jejudonensis]|uniref:hypothetical protein n=1 Tax=Kordia jejudonensis TaxID=1348245 RepID=UPI0006295922|nr:hypothetical protein [Kordia jejudonensis]
MKKKKFGLLNFKKNKISNLYNLQKTKGGTGTGPGTEGGLFTGLTNCGASCEVGCETYDPVKCYDTTRTLTDNTFYETCDCEGFASMGC